MASQLSTISENIVNITSEMILFILVVKPKPLTEVINYLQSFNAVLNSAKAAARCCFMLITQSMCTHKLDTNNQNVVFKDLFPGNNVNVFMMT